MGNVPQTDDWRYFGECVRARRIELGLTQEDVRARGGPSTATMNLIETWQKQSYSTHTFTVLERALEWEPGSYRRCLRHLAPVPLNPTRPGPAAASRRGFLFPGVGRVLAPEVEVRAATITGQVAGASGVSVDDIEVMANSDLPTGTKLFPRSQHYADRWDRLVSYGWEPLQVIYSMAVIQAVLEGADAAASPAAGLTSA